VTESLSANARRALAFGLAGLVLLLLAGIVAGPLALAYAYRAELGSVEARIDRLKARMPERERLVDEERELAGNSAEHLLLRANTPGVAAAQLQGDLQQLASALGAPVASAQTLDPASAPPYTDIGVRLTMTADISTLRDFLYAVETRDPVMIVRSFSVSRNESGTEGLLPPGTEPLTATLEVHAYLAAPPAAGVDSSRSKG
jgi:Type II secretion system (T2SS), protein M subtype b